MPREKAKPQQVEEESVKEEENSSDDFVLEPEVDQAQAQKLLEEVKLLRKVITKDKTKLTKTVKEEETSQPTQQNTPENVQPVEEETQEPLKNSEEEKRQRMIELNKRKKELREKEKAAGETKKKIPVSEVSTAKALSMKEKWNSNCRIINLNFPTLIPKESLVKRRKYQIRFTYIDEDDKKREATVRFGSVNNTDFIDNKDPGMKRKFELRYEGLSNPFDPNFWRYWMCNTEDTMVKSYCEFLEKCHLLKYM